MLCANRTEFTLYDARTGTALFARTLPALFANAAVHDETGELWVVDDNLRATGFDAQGHHIDTFTSRTHDVESHGPAIHFGLFTDSEFRLPNGDVEVLGPNPCGVENASDVGYNRGHTLVLCTNHTAFLDGVQVPTPEGDAIERTDQLIPLANGDFFLGRNDGIATIYDPLRRRWYSSETGVDRVSHSQDLGDGLLALTTEAQDTLIWDVDTASVVLRLPPSWGGQHARRTDGTMVSLGPTLRTWRLPTDRSSTHFWTGAGISMATATPDERTVVSAVGDGSLAVWNVGDGQQRWRAFWPIRTVLKHAAPTRDGQHVIGLPARGGSVRVFDIRNGRRVNSLHTSRLHGLTGRRLWTMADGSVWGTSFGWRIVRWADPLSQAVADGYAAGVTEDASASEHGTYAVLLEERRDALTVVASGSERLVALGAQPGAVAADIDDSGTVLALAFIDAVAVVDDTLYEHQRWPDLPSRPIDISLSGDGLLVAAGLRDGTVYVFEVGTDAPLARLFAHENRVSSVEFVSDTLLTAGWDGTARRFALAPLLAPRASLRGSEARWGQAPAELRALAEPGR